jgi:hypothetical protein
MPCHVGSRFQDKLYQLHDRDATSYRFAISAALTGVWHDRNEADAQAPREVLLHVLKCYFIFGIGVRYVIQLSEFRVFIRLVSLQLVASYREQLSDHYDPAGQV